MKEKKRYNAKKLSPEQIEQIQDAVFEQAEVIVSANYFIVDVEMVEENGRWYLRIYLDHPNPAIKISLEDCKDISEALEPMIDANVKALDDFSYSLEVSSPGLFRELKYPRELQFYRGRRIEMKVKGEDARIVYLHQFDRATDELVYRLSANEEDECFRQPWNAKTVKISLSPDLTEKIELKTVPRRIDRND